MRAPVVSLAVLALVASAGSALSQEGQAANPFTLVASAERCFAEAATEDGILLLWDALDGFAARPDQSASAAGVRPALELLQAHDPLHADRLALLKAQAHAQIDQALVYRGKKWGLSAADCLDLADRFEVGASRKERAQLQAALQPSEPSVLEPRGYSLLKRREAVRAGGPWHEVGDTLEFDRHPAKTGWYEWIIDAEHEDCELSVEFRSSDEKAGHDCSLHVGLDREDYFYQGIAGYFPDQGRFCVTLFERKGTAAKAIAFAWVASLPGPEGFHRLTLRVHGKRLRLQLDSTTPVEATAKVAPRGRFGLTVGLDEQDSAPITLRNFERRPWPPLTEAEQHVIVQECVRKRIVEGIDGASALLRRKELDAATHRLHVAWRDTMNLDAGPLRASLAKSIAELSAKADLLHARRLKVGQEGARSLTTLADRYVAAGQVRAACRLVELAAALDPEACEERLAVARQVVAAWQQEHRR